MGFGCCGLSKEKSAYWVNLLKTAKDLTCKIIFLWHVILCEERLTVKKGRLRLCLKRSIGMEVLVCVPEALKLEA
jgi:hypothetical protein